MQNDIPDFGRHYPTSCVRVNDKNDNSRQLFEKDGPVVDGFEFRCFSRNEICGAQSVVCMAVDIEFCSDTRADGTAMFTGRNHIVLLIPNLVAMDGRPHATFIAFRLLYAVSFPDSAWPYVTRLAL
jgi:hypothetical protein